MPVSPNAAPASSAATCVRFILSRTFAYLPAARNTSGAHSRSTAPAVSTTSPTDLPATPTVTSLPSPDYTARGQPGCNAIACVSSRPSHRSPAERGSPTVSEWRLGRPARWRGIGREVLIRRVPAVAAHEGFGVAGNILRSRFERGRIRNHTHHARPRLLPRLLLRRRPRRAALDGRAGRAGRRGAGPGAARDSRLQHPFAPRARAGVGRLLAAPAQRLRELQ